MNQNEDIYTYIFVKNQYYTIISDVTFLDV